jgi:bacillithiol biosynthesis cysteine-adding enzyme BshC
MRPLTGAYAYDYPAIAPLYAGDPMSPAAWRATIERTQRYGRRRREIADVVAAQQQRRGAPAAALAAAGRLAESSTVAVVTGQQAGLFGGPLFTLLKALTAIQLVRRVERDHGTPAVAVFWVDSEDHDWDEVRSCTILDAALQPRTLALAPLDGAGELPIAALTLDARIGDTLEELGSSLGPTDFTEWTMAALRAAYRPGVGMADAFGRWLESVLGPYGLVVFDAADPAAKPLAATVFTRELEAPGRSAALAAAGGDALAARGHEPQVVPHLDSLSLFHLHGVRRPIRVHGERLVVGDIDYTAESLAREAAASPDRFSPNVLLRPIVQDTLFPTVCYVAGPSELAYLGQLSGVYEQFGVPMPLMYPRATATLVDSAAVRFLGRYDVRIEDLQPQDEAALNRLLQAQLPAALNDSLTEAARAIRASMDRVIAAMPTLDPTLAGAAKTTLGKIEHDIRVLESKVIHAAKRRDDTLRRQFARAQVQFFPLGQPQERTLAVVFFLNRHGPALVDRLLEALPLELGQHWIVAI